MKECDNNKIMFSQQASRRKGTPTDARKSKAMLLRNDQYLVPSLTLDRNFKTNHKTHKISTQTFHVSYLHSLATGRSGHISSALALY